MEVCAWSGPGQRFVAAEQWRQGSHTPGLSEEPPRGLSGGAVECRKALGTSLVDVLCAAAGLPSAAADAPVEGGPGTVGCTPSFGCAWGGVGRE